MAFGDQINPALMNVDWSPIERGGQAKAAAIQSAGQSIEGAVGAYADYKKEQKEKEKTIKQSELYIDAAMKLFPDMAPSLQRAKMEIDDKNIPLDDRFATAESVQGLLNMGMQRMRYDSEEMHSMREAQLRQGQIMAQLEGERRKPLPTETFFEGGGEQKRVWNPRTQTYDLPEQFIGEGGGNVPELPAGQQAMMDAAVTPPLDDNQAALIAQSLQYDKVNDTYTIDNGQGRMPVDESQAMQILQAAEMGQEGQISDVGVLPEKPLQARTGFKPSEPEGAGSTIGKLAEDYKNGILDKETYEAARAKALSSSQGFEITSKDGTVIRYGGSGNRADQAAANAETMKKDNAGTGIRLVKDAMSAVRDMPKGASGVSAAIRAAGSNIPGLGGAPRRATLALEPIKNMIALDNLTALRQASPTGGALGNVSNAEGQRLEQKYGLLTAEQDPQITERNLIELTKDYLDTVYGSDAQIDKLVETGKVTQDQARQAKAEKYQSLAEIMGGQQSSQSPSALPQTQFAPKISVGEAGKSLMEQFGR